MQSPIIKSTNLGKRYVISHQARENYVALRDVLATKTRGLFRSKTKQPVSKEEFWALSDLNFEVNKGDTVGIIGRNGAGKSTLLKILSRITEPSTGRLEIDGRIASLLEVGTGFHPELTGRENIFLNGAILGMTRAEIRKKFDEIVDFSEVEKFLDTPVKRYSSGMYVKLAFAVAAHLEPEILVVDEVLAVGDNEFQKKCLGKMDDVSKKEGATVLFVSHNMHAIQQFCKRGILLEKGSLKFDGPVDEAIAMYLNSGDAEMNTWKAARPKTSELFLTAIATRVTGEQPQQVLEVTTQIKVNKTYPKSSLAFYIGTTDSIPLMEAIPSADFIESSKPGSTVKVTTRIDLPPMIPGVYTLGVWLGQAHTTTLDWQKEALQFEIVSSPVKHRTVEFPRHAGFVAPGSQVITYEITDQH